VRRSRGSASFQTIRVEGAILPPGLLRRVADGDKSLGGLDPAEYHLVGNEKLNEATNRSWNRLLGAWSAFRAGAGKLPDSDPKTSHTRERWLLPLFQELGYGRLTTARAIELDGKSFAVSHLWAKTPIHLIGCGVDLDVRSEGVAGAARMTPHGLVQELTNRSDDYLWGFVSNGLRLRILRDNSSLTRQAYVEFDLEVMMEGEAYSDFVLLWLLCHQSRVEGDKPEECWLEKWSKAAHEQGTRALDQLRDGVTAAVSSLGTGFISHPANRELRERLRAGALDKQDFYRELLRLVYRMLFIFVAEDRELLFAPDVDRESKGRYTNYYSTQRLRRLAGRRRGGKHPDLFYALRLVMQKLGSDEGCPGLGLPALGGFLFSATTTSDVEECEIANHHLLEAIRALAFTLDGAVLRPVDYRNLGSEELGSVYESLLELHPELNLDAGVFNLRTAAGNERKTTGSYYTPTWLIQVLLDSALDPVLDEAVKKPNPEEALLALKVCDPACGSGHFLIAAAHRIAKRLAAVRTGDEEPSPDATRHALREVIARCIYGVDINPMSVELCKVALWMEAIDPGKSLSFLDHHIQCGNSLIGATPRLLGEGIPDAAFDPVEGDDKAVCSEYRGRNRDFRKNRQESLFDEALQPWERQENLSAAMLGIDSEADGSIAAEHRKQEQYERLVHSADYEYGRRLADTWCAAFLWKKTREFDYPITEEVYDRIERAPDSVPDWLHNEVRRLSNSYQFFHWHMAFPDVFRVPSNEEPPENEQAGWSGGFDCVLGNPPYLSGEHRPRLITPVYQLAQRQWDTCWLFVEIAAAKLVAVRGSYGFVLPDAILGRKEPGVVRRFVLGKQSCVCATHYGSAFDAGVSVFVLSAHDPGGSDYFRFVSVDGAVKQVAMETARSSPEAAWTPHDHSSLTGKDGSLRLGNYIRISRGEEAGKSSLYAVGSVSPQDAWTPVVAGSGVVGLLEQPRATHWLVGGIRKKRNLYTSPKIVAVKTGSRIRAGIDEQSLVTLQSAYNIQLSEAGLAFLTPEFLCALLVSDACNARFIESATTTKKLFPQITQGMIADIMFPRPSSATVKAATDAVKRHMSGGADEASTMNELNQLMNALWGAESSTESEMAGWEDRSCAEAARVFRR